MLIACPDGCGETLSINLDQRMGKAWEINERGGDLTLYPSVWREGGCESHFIVWRNRIVWCGRYIAGNIEPPEDVTLRERVWHSLDHCQAMSAFQIAKSIDELVWDVERAARALVSFGKATAHKVNGSWHYLLRSES